MSNEATNLISVSTAEFRELMGRFASGVTVVTATDAGGQPAGMTASAVAAASLDPPLLLVCINHDDPFHEVISAASTFAINVLAGDQQAISQFFAGDAAERFCHILYRKGPDALPLLDGAVAHILCERTRAFPAGDHTIFLGRVTGGTTFQQIPLLHYRGRYSTPATDD